jgi:hypothetical protein
MYDMWSLLKMVNRHERLYSFPAAISTTQGILSFRKSVTDMCSSLLDNPLYINLFFNLFRY